MSGQKVMSASVWALTFAGLANAGALEYLVSIENGPLPSGLKSLQSQTGIELLYDGDVVREHQAPAVVGKLTTDAALQQLLSETELTIRRASSGAWIIERRTTAPLAQQDAAVAEILVVGRRTQNADIRRSQEDVQPYVVATGEEIRRAHRDNIDQFIASRITADTTIVPFGSQSADMMSSLNLRGLGALDTIVLIDGRRMPSIPDAQVGFRQADLNAIPLHAIDRIEVLTGAAGGIHGFGALGGVVNVILDRSVDGLELHTTQGISSRSDARRQGAEVRFGRIFNEGATQFMISGSHEETKSLRVRDREFAVRDRRRTFEVAPDYYSLQFFHGNSLTVQSLYGIDPASGELILTPNLKFKPEFGGGELGSDITYLPLGFSGDAAALTAALQEHAGEIDFNPDGTEADFDLGANPQSDSVLANFRHRFESGWEAYVDAVMLRSRGEANGSSTIKQLAHGFAWMEPESPANPFTDFLMVEYPILGLEGGVKKRIENSRYTAGIEAELPFDWRGSAEASWGRLRYFSSVSDSLPLSGTFFYLTGDASDLETNPLGDWDTFERAALTESLFFRDTTDFHARFNAQSLRVAGPIFETSAGPTTLTLLAERQSERVPPFRDDHFLDAGTPVESESLGNPRARSTRSFYGELRARLFDESAGLQMIRGLELQLAARHDKQDDDFAGDEVFLHAPNLHSSFSGTAYTVGLKVSPTSWLMLRGSYATGEQPPPIANLQKMDPFTYGPDDLAGPDAKRGGTLIGSEGEVLLLVGGNPKLKTLRARTLFLGFILTPGGEDGPRFALDYSRIRRIGDVQEHMSQEYPGDAILLHEDDWPERVTRAPLTDADRVLGYTGGRIEVIDHRDANDGALEMDAFDLRAEWPLSFLDGRLRLYADATYHQRNVQKLRFQSNIPLAGYLNGPLQRRANGGFDWSRSDLTVGANLQYFGSSLIYIQDWLAPYTREDAVRFQGSSRIPSQTYLDFYGSWRIPTVNFASVDSLTLDFGIVNVLDKSPPRENYQLNYGTGYSRYGDPRLRRFELGVSCRF